MKHDVDYELVGTISGMPLDVSGKGEMDFGAGTYSLEVNFPRLPMHWDPAFIILICCDRMLGFFAKEVGGARNLMSQLGPDYHIFEREWPIFRSNGSRLARGRASSIGGIHNGRIFNRSQIINAEFNLAIDEEVTSIQIPYSATLRSAGLNHLILSSLFEFSTNHDQNCWGSASYPIGSPKIQSSSVVSDRVVEVTRVEFDKKLHADRGTSFSFEVESQVRSISF